MRGAFRFRAQRAARMPRAGQMRDSVRKNVMDIIRQYRQLTQKSANDERVSYELEARIGAFLPRQSNGQSGKFEAGCLDTTAEKLLCMFEKAEPGTLKATSWSESQDTFFFAPLLNSDVRSTVSVDEDMLQMHCINVVKHRIGVVDLPDPDDAETTDRSWRLCLSQECEASAQKIPDVVKPNAVRIKQRKSYTYTNKDNTTTWRYDFTMTWAGKTKTEAEALQFSTSPRYEFEIELVHAHPDVSDEYLCESLLLKMQDIVAA